MAGLILPDRRRDLVIASDGDAVGISSAEAFAKAAGGLGWRVDIMEPPAGKDWNDIAVEAGL